MEKLDYLKKYILSSDKDIRIIPPNEVSGISSGIIPDDWHKIFIENDVRKRISLLLSIWKKYFSTELSNAIQYLEENLENVELLCVNGNYSILYTLKNQEDESEPMYYEGGNPLDLRFNDVLKNVWDKIPKSIRTFYETVHNGFYYYASTAMGLVPVANVCYFNDDEWEIIEELEDPLGINLETSFGFFENGMGDYIAIDYENCEDNNAVLWFHDDQPEYNINFWDCVDEWIVIGFTN